MNNAPIPISSSRRDIVSKLMTLAKTRGLDIENTDFLRAGLFGYVTDSMALLLKDSSYQKMMLYNESTLNTAILPRTIYNWAKTFNVNVPTATPAQADIILTFPVEEFNAKFRAGSSYIGDNYGGEVEVLKNEQSVLIIDRDVEFRAGNVTFTLEKSILIRKQANRYNIKYITTEETPKTSFITFQTNSIPYQIITDEDTRTDYITIQVKAVQYETERVRKRIVSPSYLDTKIHRFRHNNQLAGLRLEYIRNGAMEEIPLFGSTINLNLDENPKYGLYNIMGSNEVEVVFDSGNFMPQANSELESIIYTTLGSGGNITYTDELLTVFNNERLRDLPVFTMFKDNKAIMGLDTPDIGSLKDNIVTQLSTRDVIVTESDLNIYFNTLKKLLGTVNNGEVTFVKKRDDLIKRYFTSYIVLRDGNSIYGDPSETLSSSYITPVVPTYTIDRVTMNNESFRTSSNFGQAIVRSIGEYDKYTFIPNVEANDTDYYVIPFYMHVMLDPIKRVKYIYNLTDNSTDFSFVSFTTGASVKEENKSFLSPRTMNIYRGFTSATAADDSYKLEFLFDGDESFTRSENKHNIRSSTYKLIFYREGSDIPIDEIELDGTSEILNIVSETSNIEGLKYDTRMKFNIPVDTDNEFDFDTSDNGDFGTNIRLLSSNKDGAKTVSLPENVNITLVINTERYNVNYRTNKAVTLFQHMDDVMSSDIILNRDPENPSKILSLDLTEIPVIHSSYFDSQEKRGSFIKQLFVYTNMLKSQINNLETNTFFDMKFYRTHGESHILNTNKIDMKLELDIHVNFYNNINLAMEIQDFVRILIDKTNRLNNFNVSYLTTEITNNYSDSIDRIDFKGLNGTFSQHIKKATGTRTSTPEYFNIPRENMKYIRVLDPKGNILVGE